MAVYAPGDRAPQISREAHVHPDATVVGDVRIAVGASVWPRAVLRGDHGTISVGERTSIQDRAKAPVRGTGAFVVVRVARPRSGAPRPPAGPSGPG